MSTFRTNNVRIAGGTAAPLILKLIQIIRTTFISTVGIEPTSEMYI